MNDVELASDHPLRAAQWIWPEVYMYLYNHYAHFRHDFELPAVPRPAPFYITADQAYKLYVNGQYVGRGPARGYQEHWPFDEVDLAPYLRPGHNWLSIEGYNPGISTFQYLHQTHAGLLAAARWGDVQLATDPATWQMRRSPGHATQTARYSMQIDFQEHADLRQLDRGWITDPQPPTGWNPDLLPPAAQNRHVFRFGHLPYFRLEPRGIPLLRETVQPVQRVVSWARGRCATGYRACENVSWHWLGEAAKLKVWDEPDGITSRIVGDALELVVPPAGKGRYIAVTLAPGEYLVGNLLVTVDGAAGGELIDFQHSEWFTGNRAEQRAPGSACMIALANRLWLRKGRNCHEFFHYLGFGALTMIVRDSRQPLAIRLAVRKVGYPFTMTGEFACSDPTLNAIHAACRHTQQLCALDSYVDTPWREQAQWWGDARVQIRNTFYLDGDARLCARGIRSIAAQPTPLGLTYGHAPTISTWCILPDFSLTWVLTLRDYYWQTGDLALFPEQWPRVQEVLGYFASPEARHACGLLRHDRRLWYFGDWSELYRGEIPTFLNLWYLYTLRELDGLLDAAGMGRERQEWAEQAAALARQVREQLYDPAQGLMINGLDAELKRDLGASVHDQTLALTLDLVPEAQTTMLTKKLLPYIRGEALDGAVPSAFWSTYVIEELARHGYVAEGLAFIRRHWAPMLATGTTWENFRWGEDDAWTASHAWTAHPSFHLVNLLVGITQQAPAWRRIRFQPFVLPDVSSARAMVPSPQGPISAGWQRAGDEVQCTVSAPAGVVVEVALPGQPRQELSGDLHLAFKL